MKQGLKQILCYDCKIEQFDSDSTHPISWQILANLRLIYVNLCFSQSPCSFATPLSQLFKITIPNSNRKSQVTIGSTIHFLLPIFINAAPWTTTRRLGDEATNALGISRKFHLERCVVTPFLLNFINLVTLEIQWNPATPGAFVGNPLAHLFWSRGKFSRIY